MSRQRSRVLFAFAAFFALMSACASGLFAAALPEDIVQAEDVRRLLEQKADFALIDARSRSAYSMEHIGGAVLALVPEFYQKQELFHARVISVPPDVDQYLKQSTDQFSKDKKIVTYCNRGCQASEVLMVKLRALGFSDVKFMRDGIDAWKEKGYPVVSS